MIDMERNSLGIKGEPPKGTIFKDSQEGIILIYDPNTQFLTFLDDENIKYDQMDCSFFSDWDSVTKELESEYGIVLNL